MSQRKLQLAVAVAILYVLLSLLWSKGVVDLVCWWWQELFAARAMMGRVERAVSFLAVAFMTLFVVPYFLWVPVLVGKELCEWLKHHFNRYPK